MKKEEGRKLTCFTMASQPKSLAMSWFQCATCWKTFHLRIQLAMHIKKRHNQGGFVGSPVQLAENERDRANTDDRAEKVKPSQNMPTCQAASTFICGVDCNEQFTDLQMWSAHSLEAHKSELSQPRKASPNNPSHELSSQQTIKATNQEIPVYDISSSEDESTLPANANCESRVEVEEKVPVTTCEGLGSNNNGTVTKVIRQHQPKSTFPSQSNHLRTLSPFTNRRNEDEVLKSNSLRHGVMLRKRKPRRCPYCPQTFLLSVDNYRHIKAVHGQLLTRNDIVGNCKELKQPLIDTSETVVISKSSYPPKPHANDIRPDVSSRSTYSIQGYKCRWCTNKFKRLAVFKSHFRERHGYMQFIPSFVLKHHQSEQLPMPSRSPDEGNTLQEVQEVQNSVHMTGHSGTEKKRRKNSREVVSQAYRGESSVLLEREGKRTRTERGSKSVGILNDPPVQVEALRVKPKRIFKYKCPGCFKLFGDQCFRDDHFTKHSGKKRYKCPLCHRRIRFRQHFKNHMKRFHGQPNYDVAEAVDRKIEVPTKQELVNFLVTYNAITKSVHVALPKQV